MNKGSPLDAAYRKAGGKKKQSKSGGARKYGRNRVKCERYRSRVGKPLGRGVAGNKAH